jgi:hypothetical protein
MQIPKRVWIEMLEPGMNDACDVVVEMEDGCLYTAVFVTIQYLNRQMDLSYAMSKQLPDVPRVRYTTLETPHILVDGIERDTIEDTIDNLLELDVFEGFFTHVVDDSPVVARTTGGDIKATPKAAATVAPDVLAVQGD